MRCHCGLAFDGVPFVKCDENDPDSVCEPWVSEKPKMCDCGKVASITLNEDGCYPYICTDCYQNYRNCELQRQQALKKLAEDLMSGKVKTKGAKSDE